MILGTNAAADTLAQRDAAELAAGMSSIVSIPAAMLTVKALTQDEATARLDSIGPASLLAAGKMLLPFEGVQQQQQQQNASEDDHATELDGAAAGRHLLAAAAERGVAVSCPGCAAKTHAAHGSDALVDAAHKLEARATMLMPESTVAPQSGVRAGSHSGEKGDGQTSTHRDQWQPSAQAPHRHSRLLAQDSSSAGGYASLPTGLDASTGAAVLVTIDPSKGTKAQAAAWTGAAASTDTLLSAVASAIQNGREVATGVQLASAASLYRQGTCGNHRCELGELVRH